MIKQFFRKLYITARRCILQVVKDYNTHSIIREFNKHYGKDKYIIFNPPQGMGDILACCCGVEYLNIGEKKVFIIVNKKYFVDIQSFFPEEYVKIFFSSKLFAEQPFHEYIPLTKKMYNSGDSFISIKHNMCSALGIPLDVSFNNQYKPKGEWGELPEIKLGKTIYISPFATSCKDELAFEFWEGLANRLIDKGYDVIFNAPSNSLYSKSHRTCLFNLANTVELVTRCGFFIGWRSGLCDVIGMYANAKNIIIYPSTPHLINNLLVPDGFSYAEAYMKCCSLKTMWGVEAVEIINNSDLLNQIEKELDICQVLS